MPEEKILVVDNEPDILNMATGVLGRLGYAVKVAISGRDAMATLERERFDLVLASDALPDLDGSAVIQRARDVNPDVSTVVLTVNHVRAAGPEPYQPGTGSVLPKPFDEEDFKTAIVQALEKRELSREGLSLKILMPLFEVSSALMSEVKLERLFSLIIEVVKRETKSDRVSLMLLNEDSQRLTIKAAAGLPMDIVKSASVALGQGIAGSVAQTGKPLLINGSVSHADAVERSRIASALCVPLKVKGNVIGVLNSSNTTEERTFTRSHLEMMTILAGQAAIAIENARLFEQIEAKQATLEQLLGELLRAQEEERERVSTEIHDSVAQLMVSASYHTQSASALLAQSKFDKARDEAEHATKIIGTCVKELRGIVTDLYPPALSELGLLGALQENVEYFQKETGIVCHFENAVLPQRLSPTQEMVIYRVAQEALNNVRKHSQATEVQIVSATTDREITVEIRDNGKGFNLSEMRGSGPQSGRVGLLTMKSRAQMLGGNLIIEARPGSGTRVILTIPGTLTQNVPQDDQPPQKGGRG